MFVAVALMSLCLMTAIVLRVRSISLGRSSDFAAFYAGAHLVGEGRLYAPDALHSAERLHTGAYSPEHGYVRLPFHAALLWPLSRLEYPTAQAAWHLIRIAALVGFVVLWPLPGSALRLLWTCLCLPVFAAFINGQDTPLLLLALAAAVHLHQDGKARTGGLVFSLCAIKFHLFFLLPIWIVARREGRFAQGLAAGGALLLLFSFAAAGANWPVEWFRVATASDFSPGLGLMPNVHGVALSMGLGVGVEIVAGIGAAAATWFVARRGDFYLSLACCLACGLLVSHHAYLADMAILLPAALGVVSDRYSGPIKAAAAGLLLPPIAIATVVGAPWTALTVAMVAVFILLTVWEARRLADAVASTAVHS